MTEKMRKTVLSSAITGVLLFFLWLAVQLGLDRGLIDDYYKLNIFVIGMNIILAVSLNLINGFTGQFSIGHAGFMAIGAYVSAIVSVKLAPQFAAAFGGDIPQNLVMAAAILAGALAAAVIGFIIGMPTLRLKGDYLAIATLGMGEIIRVMILNTDYVGGASGFMGIPQNTTWTWLFLMTAGTVIIIRNFIRSTHGRACISIRENEIAAEAMGINTTKYKVMAFTMGAFFAGVAGALYAHYFYIAHPNSFTFLRSFEILVYVVLGGLGSISGSIVGATLITVISAALQNYPEVRMIVYSLLLVIMMLFRPQGIMGTKEFGLDLFKKKRGDGRGLARG